MKKFRLFNTAALALVICACGNPASDNESGNTADSDQSMQSASEIDIASIESVEIVPGLSQKTLREGGGNVAEVGNIAVVHYTGWLFDSSAPNNRGNKFDSSRDRDMHFEFPLGGGRVIRGWDQGVVGMQVGEIRELTIAPEMAYGDRQVGALIPPGSTLVFEVELADLKGLEPEPSDTP